MSSFNVFPQYNAENRKILHTAMEFSPRLLHLKLAKCEWQIPDGHLMTKSSNFFFLFGTFYYGTFYRLSLSIVV